MTTAVAANPKSILLKGDPVRKEANAAGAITPGHLVAVGSAGTATVHGTLGGRARRLFAVELDFVGSSTATDAIDLAYASGDRVLLAACRPGDEVNALAAAGALVIGDFLKSNGDGTLAKSALATDEVVAVVIEAAAGGGRVKVEVY